MKKILIVILLMVILSACDKQTSENVPTEIIKPTMTPTSQVDDVSKKKIEIEKDLCSQISKDFVSQSTGITIARVKNINDYSINACDYYLTDENNSPYIAIIVNKNLDMEKQKQIALKMKFALKTDTNIEADHYVAWADDESRIVNINLIIDANNFVRVDKNVERAIDNEGLLKLASRLAENFMFAMAQ